MKNAIQYILCCNILCYCIASTSHSGQGPEISFDQSKTHVLQEVKNGTVFVVTAMSNPVFESSQSWILIMRFRSLAELEEQLKWQVASPLLFPEKADLRNQFFLEVKTNRDQVPFKFVCFDQKFEWFAAGAETGFLRLAVENEWKVCAFDRKQPLFVNFRRLRFISIKEFNEEYDRQVEASEASWRFSKAPPDH